MERVLWAVNKTDSCLDAVGPLKFSIRKKLTEMDAVRSLVLMASTGVRPSSKNHGSKFRSLSQRLVKEEIFPYYELIEYYYNQWSQYLKLKRSLKEVRQIVVSEIEYQQNQRLAREIGYIGKVDNDKEDFFRSLVRDKILYEKLKSS